MLRPARARLPALHAAAIQAHRPSDRVPRIRRLPGLRARDRVLGKTRTAPARAHNTAGATVKTPGGESTVSEVYRIVTEKIIAMLESGTAPWRRPWTIDRRLPT